MSDSESDWLEQLAGRQAATPEEQAMQERLRRVIRARDDEPPDVLARQRLLQRLEREGWFAPHRRMWPWALAASILLVTGLGFGLFKSGAPDRGAERSMGLPIPLRLQDADPAAAAERVARELTGLGFAVRPAPEAPACVLVTVAPEQLSAFRGWAAPHSLRAELAGTYCIEIRPPR